MLPRLLRILLLASALLMQGCLIPVPTSSQKKSSQSTFPQLDFQGLMRRYMNKDKFNSIEGIYSVSGSVTKKGKGFMGNEEKEKVTDRKDNYAKVAILRNSDDDGKEFIELSLDKEDQNSYSIVGEFTQATSGSILLYKHMEAKGKSTSFTFTTDKSSELLEGIRVENEGNTTVTYKLTYVKLFPKGSGDH